MSASLLKPPERLHHSPGRVRPRIGLWDGLGELELLRHACRQDFWTFFLYAFGAGLNPKGRDWIEHDVHYPLAQWFQGHIDDWMANRHRIRTTRNLAVLVHRGVGKTTMITRAGQLWLHLRDPELSSYTGAENTTLSGKMLRAIKSVMDGSDHDALWTRLYGDWSGSASTWTGKEVVHTARKNTSRQDPSLGIFGVETSITGAHPDAIFYDDPISYERLQTDSNWLSTVNSQVSSLIPVIQSNGLVVWAGCIAVGTPVLMSDGTWKAIESVIAGDLIYTTDERGEAGIRMVEKSLDQGVAEAVTVTTNTGTICCTPWHPFLTAVNGSLAWVRADMLKHGDLITSVKRSPANPEHKWVTEDFAWLCGFILGDGWIGKNADYACIARSKDEALNERVVSILEDWIPGSTFHVTAFGYLRCNSRTAAEAFRSIGLTGGAKDKRVPAWLFKAEEVHRRAFLKGFCEADGSRTKRGDDGWSVEISNWWLIRDLRLLARTCGVRPGMERSDRERWIKAPNSRGHVLSRTSNSYFNFSTATKNERFFAPDTGTRRYQMEDAVARRLGDNFRLDRVKAVVPAGKRRVWDLTVEGSRSFVCNGFVVHNTRYDDLDHFGVAFRDEGVASISGMPCDYLTPDPEGKWHVYFMGGRDKANRPTTVKVWPESELTRYQRRDPLRYAAQVLNDPSRSEMNPLTREQLEQASISKDQVPWGMLRYAILCDFAFAEGEKIIGKDETVYYVVGYPKDGTGDVFVVEGDGSNAWRVEDLLKRLVSVVQRYRRRGLRVFAMTYEQEMGGLKGTWRVNLQNYFADANEPLPAVYTLSRGGTRKEQRLVAAANMIVDGHVRFVKDAPGIKELKDQLTRIGQYMATRKVKIDRADAFSDAFQPELYSPMQRKGPQQSAPWEHITRFRVPGMEGDEWNDDERSRWEGENPRPPIRS